MSSLLRPVSVDAMGLCGCSRASVVAIGVVWVQQARCGCTGGARNHFALDLRLRVPKSGSTGVVCLRTP